MPNKKISEFPSITTLSSNDIFLINSLNTTSTVNYSTITTDISAIAKAHTDKVKNEITTVVRTLTTVNESEDETKPVNEAGFIRQLAKMRPSKYFCAAITTTNRVIVWGAANGGESGTGGKLAYAFASSSHTTPERYIRVPFQSDWQINDGGSGIDYLDENPTVKIEDLYWNSFGALALLSDGTCWVAGLNEGDIGVGDAPTTNNFKPTCGFVKLDFGGASIKKIQAASDNNVSSMIFTALDTSDSLWVWGNTSDGCFGTQDIVVAEKISTPTKLTTKKLASWTDTLIKSTGTSVNFENNILTWAINGSENLGSSISIVTKDNKLYISGDNTSGQRGTGFKTASSPASKSGFFNQAKKNPTTFVDDAVSVEYGMYAGRQIHFYINTSGQIFGAGDNTKGYLGNGTVTNSSYFVSTVALPAGIVAEKIITCSYYYPTIYAICRNTATGIKSAYAWGWNSTNSGHCGINSNLAFINAPTQMVYRGTGRAPTPLTNVSDIFVSDQTGTGDGGGASNGCVAVLDTNGYAYLAGYKTYNDPPVYSNNLKICVRLPLKNVKEIALGGNTSSHQWSIFLLKNGTCWGLGDVQNYLFGSNSDLVKHPSRLL